MPYKSKLDRWVNDTKYQKANRTKILARRKITWPVWRAGLRKRVIDKYGGKCSCAGCTQHRLPFLTMDHPNGDGNKDRGGRSNLSMYLRLARTSVSRNHRVMCWNCNCSRESNKGVCPYEGKRH